jgi:hypothetical protein
MEPTTRFRIALSFAGEKRAYVEQVAAILAWQFGEDKILYDKFHQGEFARADLAFHLSYIYERETDLVVAVLCPDYEKKEWCGLEWDDIFGLLKKRNASEVMLTRFGRVEGKGLHGPAGYTDLDGLTPGQAASLIIERLAVNEGKAQDFYVKHTSPDDKARGAVEFTVEEGDITTFDADVLVLKHAQKFYGADATVALKLQESGVSVEELSPKIGEHVYLASRGSVRAAHVLFVGTPQLLKFDYDDIRKFSARALEVLAEVSPEARRVAMTMHGVGYGLDETAAAHAQFAGLWDSLSRGNMPRALETISIIDTRPERVKRLRALFDFAFERADYAERAGRERWAYGLDTASRRETVRAGSVSAAHAAGVGSIGIVGGVARGKETPHVFVAMPFKEEMEDVFYYGIQTSVHSIGYLCERIDQESFTGDILERVKKRIETASLVIADLTGDNPNVFLEVGYAWGKDRPTVLVVKPGKQQLRFDVQGQRCIKYKNIRNLEDLLTKMLSDLKSDGSI